MITLQKMYYVIGMVLEVVLQKMKDFLLGLKVSGNLIYLIVLLMFLVVIMGFMVGILNVF